MENYYGLIAAILSPFFSSVATIFKTGAAKNLGETLTLTQIFGAAIIIITSFLIVREHLRGTKSSSVT